MNIDDLTKKIDEYNIDWTDEWTYIYRSFDLETILKFKNQINFRWLFENQKFTEHQYDYLTEKLGIKLIVKFSNVNEEFLNKHWNEFLNDEKIFSNFDGLFYYRRNLSEKFILEHLKDICKSSILFIEMIRYYLNLPQYILEAILRITGPETPAKKLFWDNISENAKLSEKFIKKYRKYVNWHSILDNQDISLKFVKKMKKYINENDYNFFIHTYKAPNV